MICVRYQEKENLFDENVTFKDIVNEISPDSDVLLVRYNKKLYELASKVTESGEIELVTISQRPGMQTLERTTLFVLMKSFFDVIGRENIGKLKVEYSTGNGIFIRALDGLNIDVSLLLKVKERMKALIRCHAKIEKKSLSTTEAMQHFHQYGMLDKERLFYFRRASTVNVYFIDGFEDYYYGYMAPDASYIKKFDIISYQDGFVLLLPSPRHPKVLTKFQPSEKVFQKLNESSRWAEKLGCANVAALNEEISRGNTTEMILISEAMMEKQIGDIAQDIAGKEGKKFVMIAGPSSSGKTTFSHRLSIQLRANGLCPHPIAVDNYFKEREDTPRDSDGNYDFEILEAIDIEKFNEDMTKLLAGEKVELPHFNFKVGKREYNGDFLQLGREDILVIEGIHCLNDRLSYSLPKESKYKIYISALTQLNIDEHNRIPTADGRMIRRMVRDARTRGISAQSTIQMWPLVRKGENENIFPFQESADVIFNSALIYELAVLKAYVEPLLFGIPRQAPEYEEAKRLLKFLDYFLNIPEEHIPQNSILREFVGGSCFKV